MIVDILEEAGIEVIFSEENQGWFFYRDNTDDEMLGDGHLYEDASDAYAAALEYYGLI